MASYISKGCSYNLSCLKNCDFLLSCSLGISLINFWYSQDGKEVVKKSLVTPQRFFSVDEARYVLIPFVTLFFVFHVFPIVC